MSEEQPKALRLAEWAEWFCRNVNDPKDFRWVHMAKSAAELRRLSAIEAQGVPDGWQLVRTDALKMAVDFAVPAMERDRDSPSNSAWMVEAADRNISAVRAMLASAPPAPQAIPPELDVRTLLLAIEPGADGMGEEVYAKSVADVEAKLTALDQELEEWQLGIKRLPAPQASVVQQEPLGFISPKQVERIVDPDGEFGAYIPMRKTPAGNFTLAVYTHPTQQATPLTHEQKWEMWTQATIEQPSARGCYFRGVEDAEAKHGIKA